MSPEIVHALAAADDAPSFGDEDSFAMGFGHIPRGSDFMLTGDDFFMCDMTISAGERLFATGPPGKVLKLQGNGHSLRFDGTGSSLLLFLYILYNQYMYMS